MSEKVTEFSPLVVEYRNYLDKCGIAWSDNSNKYVNPYANEMTVFERTLVSLGGDKELSVIYAYHGSRGLSYGFPDYLEAWVLESKDDPVPMTVNEIMEKYFHVKES